MSFFLNINSNITLKDSKYSQTRRLRVLNEVGTDALHRIALQI